MVNTTKVVVVHERFEKERSELLEETKNLRKELVTMSNELMKERKKIEAEKKQMNQMISLALQSERKREMALKQFMAAQEEREYQNHIEMRKINQRHEEEILSQRNMFGRERAELIREHEKRLKMEEEKNQMLLQQLKELLSQEMDKINQELAQHRQRLESTNSITIINLKYNELLNNEADFFAKMHNNEIILDQKMKEVIRKHQEDKKELNRRGFAELQSPQIKQLLATSAEVRAKFKESIKKIDSIRAQCGSGLDEFVKNIKQQTKVCEDELSNQETMLVQVIEDFRELMVKTEGYQPPSGTFLPAQTPLKANCSCGKKHTGLWYHPSGNKIDTYNGNPNYEVVADGKGRWMCKHCQGPHNIEQFVFACESHRGDYRPLKP